MSLRERIKVSLEERKKKIEEGGINCLPLPFERFRQDFPGIEQGSYYLISGATKSGKTQVMNYIFVYNTVLYCYYHPERIQPKIFFFPLEETDEAITLRFMAYLLNHLSKGKIRVSPTDLRSTDERKPLKQEVLDAMDSEEFKKIMDIYESIITFYDDRNPTGVWKNLNNYAKTHGTIVTKTIEVKEVDDLGMEKVGTREIFDHYVPDNPEEYVFIIVDHVSLLDTERGMNLRESINKLSEYMIILRNRYNYIPVVVQQQSVETQNLEAFKNNKIRPTVAGLADSKYTARDCNVMIGITNPHNFEMDEYLGYQINKGGIGLKGNARFLEIVINRNGNANGICPLFFDGAINDFRELPLPTEKEKLEQYYNYARAIRQVKVFFTLAINKLFKHLQKWQMQ